MKITINKKSYEVKPTLATLEKVEEVMQAHGHKAGLFALFASTEKQDTTNIMRELLPMAAWVKMIESILDITFDKQDEIDLNEIIQASTIIITCFFQPIKKK